MDHSNWMSAICDEAPITKIAIPASHNSCTKGMGFLACCQDGSLYEQFKYGVRQFGVLYQGMKNGKLRLAHGIILGEPLETALADIRKIIDECPGEFLIIDLRKYSDDKYGPFQFKHEAYPEKVDELIEKYLEPEKYALTEFDDIRKVTLGDIRATGKRYIIIDNCHMFKAGADCEFCSPWDSQIFGYKAPKFAKESLQWFDKVELKGFFDYQAHMTPGPGTEVGIKKWARGLNKEIRPYFAGMIKTIEDNPKYLDMVNMVSSDFMTEDHMKSNAILNLNLLKGYVKEEYKADYENMLKVR